MRTPVWLILLLLSGMSLYWTCTSPGNFSPKPRGYHRIIFPEKSYTNYQSECAYSFDYPSYASIEQDQTADAQACWIDVVFTSFNARLHLSYLPIRGRAHLEELLDDSRKYAYAHISRATAIEEHRFAESSAQVNGLVYEISGNVASPWQFFATDSSKHYLRGALYFNEAPRADSLQPVVEFLREDLDVLIRSLRWQ